MILIRSLMLDAELVKMSCKRSRSEVFCKKGVLRDFTKFTGKHLCQSLFFGKVAGLRHRCFTVNFVKFLKTPFYIVHLCRLLHVLGNLCLINHLSASHSVKSVRVFLVRILSYSDWIWRFTLLRTLFTQYQLLPWYELCLLKIQLLNLEFDLTLYSCHLLKQTGSPIKTTRTCIVISETEPETQPHLRSLCQ